MEETKREELTLEESFEELDRIVETLEDREVSLEDSFRAYQKGMELLKSCGEKIDTVEKQMLQISRTGELEPFETGR